MKKPSIRTSNEALHELEVYLLAQLKADKEARHLIPLVGKAGAVLRAAAENHGACTEAMITAMAMRDRADADVDDYLRMVFHTAQGIHGARSERIKHLFPGGLNLLIAGPIPDQPGQMRVLAAKLSDDGVPQLSSHAELVMQKAGQLDEGVGAYEAAVEQVSVAYAGVLRARAEWIRAYEKTYGELVSLFGKKRADSFFKKAQKGKKKATAASDI
jgi:hypothetical protein